MMTFGEYQRKQARLCREHHLVPTKAEAEQGMRIWLKQQFAPRGSVQVVHAPGRSDRAYHGGQFHGGEW